MDRIDRNDDALRVIDYKFKFGANRATQDKNLIRAAMRGERCSHPSTTCSRNTGPTEQHLKPLPDIEADFYYISPRWADGPLISTPYG